jgi:pyruvate/2-oxoacid:ferredoxin oxidoreductase alpha subunit
MEKAKSLIREIDQDYGQVFGRGYGMIEAVDTVGAEIVLVTSGAMTSTARVAVQSLRDKDVRAGLLKIKTFRPFPWQEVQEVLRDVPRVAVVDRNISIGKEGIFCQELKAALYPLERRPLITGFIAGLCGADVSPEMLEEMVMGALGGNEPENAPIWVA